MDALYLILGAGIFAGGLYVGWRAAYSRQEVPSPQILPTRQGESVILDEAPDWPPKIDPEAPVFP